MPSTSPAATSATRPGSAASLDRSRAAPTDTKNRPSSSPLKGSTVTSISRLYSVSASSSPAMKAPSAIDRPLTAATALVPISTNRQAAMKNSVERVAATRWNSGRSTSRPRPTMAAMASAAGASVQSRPGTAPPASRLARNEAPNRRGATARSWNSSTAKAVRPAPEFSRLRSASSGITIAVEDRASVPPSSAATATGTPMPIPAAIRTSPDTPTCNGPSPNTSRRRADRRSNDSSSPIMNIRNTTPNSATAAT